MLLAAALLASTLLPQEPVASPSPPLDQLVPTLRRELRHDTLLERFAAAAELADADGARLAAWTAEVAAEKRLLERVRPLDALRALPADVRLTRLLALTRDAHEELALARYCFLHGAIVEGEASLGRARDLAPDERSVKDESDRLLAEARGLGDVPRGGFFRYRGAFVPMERRDRERGLDDALERLATAGVLDGREAFAPRHDVANLEAFEERFGAAGPDMLRRAAERIRAALEADYEAVRGWLPSYGKQPSLRNSMIESFDTMRAPRRELLELIARYDKPEQPVVDRSRRQLEKMYAEYAGRVQVDRRALAVVGAEAAGALLERVRAGESALDAVDRYLDGWAPPRLAEGRVVPWEQASVTARRVLSGRRQTGLEDVLWIVVHFAADRAVETIERVDEMLTQRDRLTPWERLALEDFRADAIDRYNARCVTSVDAEERRFLAVVNDYRRALGRRPFELEERLVTSARKHSREMRDLGYFGHVSPIERHRGPTDRARLEGYGGGVGENCLGGRVDGRGAFEGWYHSPGHHRGMVSDSPEMGIGATRDHGMWTMVMGGTDRTWRSMHRVDEPAELLAAAALARDALARFADPRAADRDEWPSLLARVVADELPTAWRALQLAAVDACLDGMEIETDEEVRRVCHGVVGPLIDAALPYDADAAAAVRRRQVFELRQRWQDVDRVRFRQRDAEPPAERLRAVGRAESPSLEAPLKVLSDRERLTIAKRLGGGTKTEKAVERGLQWLARVQNEDGAWRSRSFAVADRRFAGKEKELGLGNAEWEIGMTGLSLLAFLSAGHTPQQGKHAEVVDKGVRFLCAQLVDDGRFRTTSSHYMYSHALATQALCEAYAYTGDPFFGVCAQLGLDYLVYAQHRPSGGWRYTANEAGDTSVSGWVVMALNSGAKARLDVAGFRGALRFLNSVTSPSYFRIGYTGRHDGGTVRLGAVGMLLRLFLEGNPRDARIRFNAWRCLRDKPARGARDFYYWYYATLSLHQVGGKEWDEWNAALVPALLAEQVDERRSPFHGSWGPRGEWSDVGGRVYQTALGVLMFTTYYRYDRGRSPRVVPFTGDLSASIGPYLDRVKHAEDPVVRAVAAARLMDVYGTGAASTLIAELRAETGDDEARRRIAELLPDCVGPPQAAALLELLTAEPDDRVQESLIGALEAVAGPSSVDVLVGFLGSERREVRVCAARTLGRVGDPRAVAPLGECLAKEQDGWARSQIDEALLRLAHRKAIDQFVGEALPDDPRRLPVLDGLSLLDTSGVAARVVGLKAAEPRLYRAALDAVRTHREAATVPLLIAVLASEDQDVRSEAFKLLQAVTGEQHGFDPAADREPRDAAVVRWRAWWKDELEGLRDN